MAKKPLTREQKVFNKLAATGRYVSTGKVLIGLSYVPRARHVQSFKFKRKPHEQV